MTIVDQLETLARRYHAGQFRKDGTTPYVEHPAAVVARMRAWGVDETNGEDDAVALAVAWGHDLLEDTAVTEGEIAAAGTLGERVLVGIRKLTFARFGESFDEHVRGPKEQAKARYIEDVGADAPPEILVVKISDRLSNARDFMKLTRLKKARDYLCAGAPLFRAVDRLRPSLRVAIEADLEQTEVLLGIH